MKEIVGRLFARLLAFLLVAALAGDLLEGAPQLPSVDDLVSQVKDWQGIDGFSFIDDMGNFKEDQEVCARLCAELVKGKDLGEQAEEAYNSSSALDIVVAKEVTKLSFEKGWVLPFGTKSVTDEEGTEKKKPHGVAAIMDGTKVAVAVAVGEAAPSKKVLVAPKFNGVKSLYELACDDEEKSCKELSMDQSLKIALALVVPLKELHKHGIEHAHVNMQSILVSQPAQDPSGQAVVQSSASSNNDDATLEIMVDGTHLLLTDIHLARSTADSNALYKSDAYGIATTIYGFGDESINFKKFKEFQDEKVYSALKENKKDIEFYLTQFSPVGLLNRPFWNLDFDEMEPSQKSMWKFLTMACMPDMEHNFDHFVKYLMDDGELGEEDVLKMFVYAEELQRGPGTDWFDSFEDIISKDDQQLRPYKEDEKHPFFTMRQTRGIDEKIKAALGAAHNFTFIFSQVKNRLPGKSLLVSRHSFDRWEEVLANATTVTGENLEKIKNYICLEIMM
eukprot:GHVS01022884.1.p1 GENE.GHVS01022884.1~~GHVS01022884.1.p1  ORF type:complete len:505 (-),score=77.18 GHVS01022884.1:594-2108(-)